MTWHEVRLPDARTGPPVAGADPLPVEVVGGGGDLPERVLLVRDETGRLHATGMLCPHLGQPLSMGEVDGTVLECAGHAFRYRLADGTCEGPGGPLAGRLAVHPVRERDGRVEVLLETP